MKVNGLNMSMDYPASQSGNGISQEEYERQRAQKRKAVQSKIDAEKEHYNNLKKDLITIAAIKGQLLLSEENLSYAQVQLGKASEKISVEKFNAEKIEETAKECEICKDRTKDNIKKVQDECAKLDTKNAEINILLEESTQTLENLYAELANI